MIIQFKYLLGRILPCFVIGLLFLAGCDLSNGANNSNNASSVQKAHKSEWDTDNWIHETPRMPEYIGDNKALIKLIETNLHYPEGDTLEGTVAVGFTVTRKGKVVKPYIRRGLSPAMDKEALRIVRLFKYKPFDEYMDKEPVEMTFPIKFRRKRK